MTRRPEQTSASLRDRIVQAMAAHPSKVFTPARVALLVGASSKDSMRNTLLALAKQGRVKKLGPGRYRALAMPKADGPARRSH